MSSTNAAGQGHIGYGTIMRLAIPLSINSGLQALLNLTDAWFIGRISAEALAAVGGVYWLIMAVLFLFGGVGFVVQTFAAQAFGRGQPRRAVHACWAAVWVAFATIPIFIIVSLLGRYIVPFLGMPASVSDLSIEYWGPRMIGGPAVVALWATLSLFMGIGHVKVVLAINLVILISNIILNEWLIFGLGLGLAGAGWATSLSLYGGLALAFAVLLGSHYRLKFSSHRVWQPRMASLRAIAKVGGPVGAWIAGDLLGLAAFQAMMSRISVVDGAATQIVMMLTSIAFMPAVGIGMAGTTLVGQAIGAGKYDEAYALGNRIIWICAAYMFATGIALSIAGPWLMPLFVKTGDIETLGIIELGKNLLWVAAVYQLFDGLNLGSGFCLRSAGDTNYPACALIGLSAFLFIPLAHLLAFAPGGGWLQGVPGLGFGAIGGWIAAVAYIVALGLVLTARWRSQHWKLIRLN